MGLGMCVFRVGVEVGVTVYRHPMGMLSMYFLKSRGEFIEEMAYKGSERGF